MGKLNIRGSSMDVELVGEAVPGLPKHDGVKQGGRPVPVATGVPLLQKEVELQGERAGDDDEWTLVGDEDGNEEATKKPPPSYDDAMRQ